MNHDTFPQPPNGQTDIEQVLESKAYVINTHGLAYPLEQFFLALGQSLQLKKIQIPTKHESFKVMLEEFARLNHFKLRTVTLDEHWQRLDQGPMIGFDQSFQPYLLCMKSGRYQVSKGLHQASVSYKDLIEQVYIFYPLLPNHALRVRDLFRFNYRTVKADLWKMIGFHFLLGLVLLVLPLVTGVIFDEVIPGSDRIGLQDWTFVLLAMVALRFLLSANIVMATIRIRFKSNVVMQAAIWQRVIALPLSFFFKMNAGDLADRASVIDAIAQILSATTLQSILSGIFSILTFALMLWYAPFLSFILLMILILFSLVYAFAAAQQIQYQRQSMDLQGRNYGFIYQVFQNIGKIQVQNRQTQVHRQWENRFLQSCRALYKAQKIGIHLDLIGYIIMIAGLILIYLYTVYGAGFASFGTFMIFSALYTQFMTAFLGLVGVGVSLAQMMAYVKRAEPILKQSPEISGKGLAIETIAKLDLHGVYFRYDKNESFYHEEAVDNDHSLTTTPWVVKNISLKIESGDFVAIVGPSGSGKTTLAKILLGLLDPQTGSFSVNDFEMNLINRESYRQHFGLVMQNTLLYPGSILSNVTQDRPHLKPQVWALAKSIGFDEFLESLPMGLDTVVAEGGRNLSVGQRQRLLIIKALIDNPSIIILDEATSALDNEAQNKVFKYLEQKKMTRIVVTHRLQAIKEADRIYTLDGGELIDQGSYYELAQRCHFFQMLIKPKSA